MTMATVSPAMTTTLVVADLKPWSSAARAQTPAGASANRNSPRSFETSILGSVPPHVSVSVTPGTTNGWPSGDGTDTAPAIADVVDCAAAADPPSVDTINRPRNASRLRVIGRLLRRAPRHPSHRPAS